ncbi:sodium-dependent transporter [Endozoicomonadaceae bacterium StTr2]
MSEVAHSGGGVSESADARAGNPMWSSRLAFILAASGSAVGLGNIWKFPYITGENGGGAFVLVYLLCIAIVGLPILIAEVMIGRWGGGSPIRTMQWLVKKEGLSRHWVGLGWLGVSASFLILTFYSVIGGWAVSYVGEAANSSFAGASSDEIGSIFGGLLSNPWQLFMWHSVFMLAVVMIVARGLKSGMEKAINILMPLLFLLLLVMVGYAASTDHFYAGIEFLFAADFSKLSTEAVLSALGHAFFTLSIGVGVMFAYGSFLPKDVPIVKTAVTISVVDTGVALLAGLAIFPLVFANGLEPGAGPGLIFQTLPLAFGKMAGGVFFGTLFFALLVIAALTSAISMLEPTVEWLEERQGFNRMKATIVLGALAWIMGIGTVLSFNEWAEFYPLAFIPVFEGKTIFDILDYLTANLIMPLSGLCLAVFAGWFMSRKVVKEQLGLGDGILYDSLIFTLRFLTPAAVAVVFIYNLI